MSSKKRTGAPSNKNSKKAKHDSSKLFFPTPRQFLDTCLPQEFSLPLPLMKYIWENPSSPQVYQKLIKCSKLFFIKNPMLVIYHLIYRDEMWRYCKENGCNKPYACEKGHKRIADMNKLNRIWLTDNLWIDDFHIEKFSKIASEFLPKIYKCDVQELRLDSQDLLYDELKTYLSGVQKCSLCYNIVKHANGEEVHLEDLVKLLSGGKKFFINFGDKPYNTTCKSFDALIDACNTVEEVELHLIPDTINVPQFYKHLKDHKSRALIKICLLNPVPGVDEVIDEILHTETFEFVPPVIGYFQDGETLDRMQEIRTREAQKYR